MLIKSLPIVKVFSVSFEAVNVSESLGDVRYFYIVTAVGAELDSVVHDPEVCCVLFHRYSL